MPTWTCPKCGRPFAKRRAHVCAPGMTVDAYFAGKDPKLRKIFDAVAKHLRTLGELHLEAVSVGILFKRERTFAELRPRTRPPGFALSLVMRRPLDDPRISRSMAAGGEQLCHIVVLQSAKDVDARVRDWLTESYAS